MYRKQWGLLLSEKTHLGEIDTTVVGEWHTAREKHRVSTLFNVYGPPTHVYCDSPDLYTELAKQTWLGVDPNEAPFKAYGPPEVKEVYLDSFIRGWMLQVNSPERYKAQLEAKDREIHDLKCELERVRMTNDGLFKKLGV